MLLSGMNTNNEEYNIISSKNDVSLYKSRVDNTNYRISFNINIPNDIRDKIKPNKYINIELYEILQNINSDVIEKIDVLNNEGDEDSYLILFRFNHLGKELGLKKKYMLSKIKFIQTNDNKCSGIVSNYVKLENLNLDDYDEIKCDNSNLLSFIHEGGIGVYYDFKLDLNQELPSYMKDFGALLMKKIFIRMREYIALDILNNNK